MHRNLQQESASHSNGQVTSPPAPAVVNFSFDHEMLREVVEEIMADTFAILDWPACRIALTEVEAAVACGVGRHVLRDLRLGGHTQPHKIGRQILYTRNDVLAALNAYSTQHSQ